MAGFSDATGAIRFSSEHCSEEKRIALAGAWGAARPPNRGQGGGSSLAAGGAQHEKIAPDLRIGPDPVCCLLYTAHRSGSKYALYSEEMRKRVLYEKNIESCMEEALRNREFCLHLQPQVDIQHGDALFGAEVLVRWERPGYGMVSPGDFIPLFERNGFIVDLDAFVFEEACAYLASQMCIRDSLCFLKHLHAQGL